PVGDDVAGLALGDDEAVVGAYDLVAEADGASAQLRDVRADDQQVVVVGGGLVAAVTFGDDEECLVVLLHLLVGEAARAAELRAADREPDEGVRVVHYAHAVGLGVADAAGRLV